MAGVISNQEWGPKDCQLCPAHVPWELWGYLSWAPGQALVVVPPCRLQPQPPSRYLNPRPPKCAEQTPLDLQGLCLSCSPLCLLATKSGVSQRQWQHCVLSLCTALLASTCPCSCHCHSSVPRQLQVGTGDTRTLQLLNTSWGKCCPPGGKCHSGCCHLCFLLHWLQSLLTIDVLAKVWLTHVALWSCVTQTPGYMSPMCHQGL